MMEDEFLRERWVNRAGPSRPRLFWRNTGWLTRIQFAVVAGFVAVSLVVTVAAGNWAPQWCAVAGVLVAWFTRNLMVKGLPTTATVLRMAGFVMVGVILVFRGQPWVKSPGVYEVLFGIVGLYMGSMYFLLSDWRVSVDR